jgi:hypothetical protein
MHACNPSYWEVEVEACVQHKPKKRSSQMQPHQPHCPALRRRSERWSWAATFSMVFKPQTQTGHWWLTPVILATQEAEIRRITV